MKTNPTSGKSKPPFPQRKIKPPGKDTEMNPAADHGEESYRGSGLLEGKRALITGGDSGIGRAVAIAFAREGADVAIGCLREELADAGETKRWIERAGRQAVVLPGDIGDSKVCRKLARDARGRLGGIDILVNNAAFQRTYAKFEDIPEDEFEETFRVNVFAMFRLCQHLLPHIPNGGSILNTASIQSFDPSETLVAYAATKAAIASFTKSLSALAVKQGVRVNAVAPGPVWTPLIPATLPKKATQKFGESSAFGRPAQPAEIAPIFVFLASSSASFVTGEVYGATGGQMPI